MLASLVSHQGILHTDDNEAFLCAVRLFYRKKMTETAPMMP